jgi:hypothetical protein
MAAAIIGAFELNYSRTNLGDGLQRYLAHFTKFTLYDFWDALRALDGQRPH